MPTSVRKRIEDLIRIGESISWPGCPEAANQRMVDVLAEVLGCEAASIHILDFTGDYMLNYASHGNLPEDITIDMQISITTGRTLQMMATHQPVVMDFQHPDPADRILKSYRVFRSAISVPILAGDDMLGMFSLVYKKRRRWTVQDIEHLINIGRMLGISVQHARAARKVADLEILIERKRLCMELHDNLSQLVSSLKMGAEAALLSWQESDLDRLRSDLERIRNTGQETERTLREEMLSLRTPTNETEGLIPGISECLKRFEQQWRIETALQVKGGLEPLVVPTQMELQFIRILHEALSNVLRHATASQVNVVLQGDPYRLSMQIHDNGQGFDPDAVSCEHLGLRIMRERAEALGGELTIGSGDGVGTTICVDVPRYT